MQCNRLYLLYRKLRFRKAKKILCPAERPLRVLGDGQFENGRRVTAKPFSYGVSSDYVCKCFTQGREDLFEKAVNEIEQGAHRHSEVSCIFCNRSVEAAFKL